MEYKGRTGFCFPFIYVQLHSLPDISIILYLLQVTFVSPHVSEVDMRYCMSPALALSLGSYFKARVTKVGDPDCKEGGMLWTQ